MKTHKALRDVSASTVSAFTPRRKSTGSWWTQGPRTLSGCAHNGILNILDRYRELYGSDPDAVISGFHMSRKPHYSQADLELVRQTGEELRRLPVRFYTGHCTGEIPYRILKDIMGEQLSYVQAAGKSDMGMAVSSWYLAFCRRSSQLPLFRNGYLFVK